MRLPRVCPQLCLAASLAAMLAGRAEGATTVVRAGDNLQSALDAAQPLFQGGPWLRSPRHVIAFFVTLGGVVAYIAFAEALGFLIVGPLVLLALFIAYGVRPVTAVVTAIAVSLVIHYAFYKLLRVPLPWGVLTPF